MTAIEAIGTASSQDDYVLKPENHSDRLPAEAGPLKRILESAQVTAIVKSFRELDQRALDARDRFKQMSQRLVILTSITVLSGGLFLLFNQGEGSDDTFAWQYIFLAIEGLALLGTAVYVFRLRDGKQFEEWMATRATAEDCRKFYFETVCGIQGSLEKIVGPINANELPVLPLQLEYFRRYQLEVQLNYYKTRSEEHRRSARTLRTVGVTLILVAAFLATLQNLAGDWLDSALGVSSLALYAFAGLILPVAYQAREIVKLLSGDLRNAFRYDRTHYNLGRLKSQLQAVRDKVDTGDRETFHAFVREVQDEISVEHREWARLSESANSIPSALG